MQGGLDGIAEMLKDVHLIRLDLDTEVIKVIPQFVENTQKENKILKEEVQSMKVSHNALKESHADLLSKFSALNVKFEAFNYFNESFLSDSTIANKTEHRKFVNHLILNGRISLKISTVLLYRGSAHGWKYADWHSRCDNKGSTLTLFRVKETDLRCGGYTTAQWEGPSSGVYKPCPSSFLFSLDKNVYLPVKDSNKATYCSGNWGPTFGDNCDLAAYSEPFNSSSKCRSFPEKSAYQVPKDQNGNSVLTGCKDSFEAAEIECY